MVDGAEQKRTEPSFLTIRPSDPISFQEPRKKFLREIPGIIDGIAAAPNVTVEWIPIDLAKSRQRFLCVRRIGPVGCQHHRPASRGKYIFSRTGQSRSF